MTDRRHADLLLGEFNDATGKMFEVPEWSHWAVADVEDAGAAKKPPCSEEAMNHLQDAYDSTHNMATNVKKQIFKLMAKGANTAASGMAGMIKQGALRIENGTLHKPSDLLFRSSEQITDNEAKAVLKSSAQDLEQLCAWDKQLRKLLSAM